LPADKPVFLQIDDTATIALEQMPEILRKFAPGDICVLELKAARWPDYVRQMYDWNRLDTVIFDKTSLEAKEIPALDTLTHLKTLQFEKSDYDAPALARLKIIRQLHHLELSGMTNADPILKAIAGSNQLEVFSAYNWPCDSTGLSYLAQCPNLREIHLTATDLTDQDILLLEKMPHLRQLHFKDTRLTPDCIPYFRRLRLLKRLYLQDLEWSTWDKWQLKKATTAHVDF